jgi:hypothetical protein
MSARWRTFIVVVGILMAVVAIGPGRSTTPLYDQAAEDNWVPDLRGTWNGEVVE